MKEYKVNPPCLTMRNLGFSILNKLDETKSIPSDLRFEIETFGTKLVRLNDVAKSIEQYLNGDIEADDLRKKLEFYNSNKARYSL